MDALMVAQYPNDQGNYAGAIPVWGAPAPSSYLTGSAAINFSTSGDNIIVAPVAGQTIRAFRLFFVVGGPVSVTIKDGTGTALTGPMPLSTNGSLTFDLSALPWFTTSAGNVLIVNTNAAVQVSGKVDYMQS